MPSSLVTVYIPSRFYGHFLDQAVASVSAQSYRHWELLIIDDGSEDQTASVAARWAATDGRIRILRHKTAKGLPACANTVLRAAKGDYILRLDADDYLDENALLVMADYLDQHREIALVYPNYFHVDERGRSLGVERRKRVGTEAQFLDLPAHGACTMVRRSVLKQVNGYSELQDRQDGYDLWLKLAGRYPVANIETALFYYRHHGASLSHDQERLLLARRQIKRHAASNGTGAGALGCCVAVVPAKNTYAHLPNVVLSPLAGKPLIDYTLEEALAVGAFQAVIVSTDDPGVRDYAKSFSPGVLSYVRPKALSEPHVGDETVLQDTLSYLERERGITADTVVSLAVNCPLRRREHIQEALDTLALFEADMILSVYEDYDLHFVHGTYGLEPLNPAMHLQIRLEREALYVWNGAVRAVKRDNLSREMFRAQTVGHVVMPYRESMQIKTEMDRKLVESVLAIRGQGISNEVDSNGENAESRGHVVCR
jgi:CMP-N-acetylneuraminic acid synthetase